ncbi:hypothetical protein ACLOJK_036306 [Asimina triloba]
MAPLFTSWCLCLSEVVYSLDCCVGFLAAESFPGRSDVQCLHRWQKVLNPDLIKGPWTKEEDDRIIQLVEKYGCKKWSVIARSLPGRIGKQCRERWHNHLNPAIKKDAWTKEEELILIRAHNIYGNKWAEIARLLPGSVSKYILQPGLVVKYILCLDCRADNSIKNHWNCSVKKKLDSYSSSELLNCPGGVGSLNQYNQSKEERNAGDVEGKQGGSSKISFSIKSVFNVGSGSYSLGSLLENAGEKEHCSDNKPLQMEMSYLLKEEAIDRVNSPIATPHNVRYSMNVFHQLVGMQQRDEANSLEYQHDSSSFKSTSTSLVSDLHCQIHCVEASDLTDTNLSLGTRRPFCYISSPSEHRVHGSTGTPVSKMAPFLATNEWHGCKNIEQYSTLGKGIPDINMSFICHSISPSNSQDSEFGNNPEISVSNKRAGAPLHSGNVNFGDSCDKPPQPTTLSDPASNGRSANKEWYDQREKSLASCFTLQNHLQNNEESRDSPQSILRSAAKSFKNTPSILRKRARETLKLFPLETSQTVTPTANDGDDVCTPEARNQSNDSISGSVGSCMHQSPEECSFTEVLNVKRFFPSPPHSLRTRNAISQAKSIEKRLAFDSEWDDSSSKRRPSADTVNLSNGVPGARRAFMPLDNIDISRMTSKRQNSLLLGGGFDVDA